MNNEALKTLNLEENKESIFDIRESLKAMHFKFIKDVINFT